MSESSIEGLVGLKMSEEEKELLTTASILLSKWANNCPQTQDCRDEFFKKLKNETKQHVEKMYVIL